MIKEGTADDNKIFHENARSLFQPRCSSSSRAAAAAAAAAS